MQHNRKELTEWIKNDPRLAIIWKQGENHEGGDAAHDLSHLLRVALWTIELGGAKIDRHEAVAAALLHDFVNIPKDHPDRARASEYSAQKALPLLRSAEFSEDACERICSAIREHSYSRGERPSTVLGAALQDADRLEAIGAIGLMRVFSTGARMNTSYFNAEDPWAEHRPLDDKKYSIDHFFTKLLKLPATFNTEEGKKEAARRAQVLETFLDQAAAEIGVPRP